MPNKMIFASLLASFGVPLTVYPRDSGSNTKGGQYVHGEWVPDADIMAESNKKEVLEPFIPYGMLTRSGHSAIYKSGGRMEESDKQWFSSLDVPIGSFLVHSEVTYEVIDCDYFQDYSDTNIYGCKAVSAFE